MKSEDINQEQRDVITTMLIDNFDEDFRTNNNNNNSNHKIVYSNAEQTTLTAIKENFINGHKGSKVTGYISFNEFRLAIFRSLKQIRTLVQETSFYPSLRPSYKKATNNNRDEKSHARNNSSTATDKDKSKQSKLCNQNCAKSVEDMSPKTILFHVLHSITIRMLINKAWIFSVVKTESTTKMIPNHF